MKKQSFPHRHILIIPLSVLLLSACNESPKHHQEITDSSKTAVTNTSPVLATVNGSSIHASDLDFAITKLVGEENIGSLDEAARRKILESMVMSRAIAQEQEKGMDSETGIELEQEISAYREQLLVRRYLAANVPPKPISMEMVKEYYESHPELFGAKQVRLFEMISAKRAVTPKERDELMTLLQNPAKQSDWKQWTDTIGAKGYPLVYSLGKDTAPLDEKLLQSIRSLDKGQSSSIIFIQDIPYLIRITELQSISPRPLSEVAGSIKQSLAPRQLKEAIQEAGRGVLQRATVEYKEVQQ